MAKTEKKEDIKPVTGSPAENKDKPTVAPETKPAKKSRSRIVWFFIFVLAATAGVVAYDKKLSQTRYIELAGQISADYNDKIYSLDSRLNALELKLKQIQQQQNSRPAENSRTLSDEQLQALAGEVAALLPAPVASAEIQAKADTQPAPAVTAPEILLAAGSLTVRGLAEEGLPFDYETEVLQILAAGNEPALAYINSIKKYAASGITGRTMLISEFNKVYADLSRPQQQKDIEEKIEESWDKALWSRMKELVVFRKRENKTKIIFPQTPDEIHQLVNRGKFAEALSKIKTDRKYSDINSAELNSWITQTQNYLEFDRAINGLIMNALANLHLKEMERH